MKRTILGVLAMVMVSAIGLYAQAKPAAPADKAQPTVFRGCLVPGSGGEFMLIKGKEKGSKDKETKNYFLVEENKDVDIQHFQTMEVEVTGNATVNGTKTVITVSKVKRLSDYCG